MSALMAAFATQPGGPVTPPPTLNEYVIEFVTGGVYTVIRAWHPSQQFPQKTYKFTYKRHRA